VRTVGRRRQRDERRLRLDHPGTDLVRLRREV